MRTDMAMERGKPGGGTRDTRPPAPARPEGRRPESQQRVCVGIIVGAHGVRGAVRVKSFTQEPGDVAAYGALTDEAGAKRYALKPVGTVRGVILAEVEGVADRNAAEALRGVRLYVERGRFPRLGGNQFYHADLIGLEAETADGAPLGRVRAVDNYGAGDVIELELTAGGSVVLPFNRQSVPAVDLAAGRIVVDPPEGLMPQPAAAKGKTRRPT